MIYQSDYRLLARFGLLSTVLFVLFLLWVSDAVAGEGGDPLFPSELVEFTPYAGNPVFVDGGEGAWDELIRERCWILRDGDEYRMWYTGYMPDGVMRLGHATSSDGIAWKRHESNPLYSAHWIEDIQVVRQDGVYYMFAEGLNDIAHLFVSEDGVAWKRKGPLDIRKQRGGPIAEGPRGTPVAWYDEGRWYLLYERDDKGIWLASSSDMEVWTNVRDKPVLMPGPDSYDDRLIAANQVIKRDGRYYLYYHGKGEASKHWMVNVAVSTDLLEWRKYSGNPVLPSELNLSSGFVVPDGTGYRLYTTHRQVDLFLSQ